MLHPIVSRFLLKVMSSKTECTILMRVTTVYRK